MKYYRSHDKTLIEQLTTEKEKLKEKVMRSDITSRENESLRRDKIN
ncbi:hypothetical protein [Ammoniphilus sp. YIM 78166]|nr:hypothetical protein [Ammoniphilus sp. YIM 78166]